jgi:hypothetical protein
VAAYFRVATPQRRLITLGISVEALPVPALDFPVVLVVAAAGVVLQVLRPSMALTHTKAVLAAAQVGLLILSPPHTLVRSVVRQATELAARQEL